MAPFLYDDVGNLLRVLMQRFIKKSVVQMAGSVMKLVKVDVSNKQTCCTHKEVDIGVGAANALSTTKLTEFERK